MGILLERNKVPKMATKQILQLYGYTIAIVLFYTSDAISSTSSDFFIVQPQDTVANEGDNVSFSCSVNNLDRTRITWTVKPDHLKQDRTEEFTNHLTSELMIIDIDQYDHYITCTVTYASDKWRTFPSRRAKLSVQHFPTRNKLTCAPQNAITLLEGDSFEVHCAVDRGKPTVDLSWRLEPQDSDILPSFTVNDYGLIRNLSGSLVASQELHNKRIICIVTSVVAFPGRSLECPIGPIRLLSSPVVIVHPRNAILEDNMAAGFTCMADGFPQVYNFSWSCTSNVKLEGCNTTSVSANISVAHIFTSSSTNDTERATITCTAMNTVGSDTYSSHLMIKQKIATTHPDPDHKTLASGRCSYAEPLNITLQLQEQIIQPTEQMALWCNVTMGNLHDIEWKWYYDGFLITEGDKDFMLEKLSMSSFTLYLLRFAEARDGKEVLCEVTVCDQTVKAAVNLSVYPAHRQSRLSESGTQRLVPPSETPALPVDPEPRKLAMWKIIAMAIAGALVTIVLTACVVALVSILLYRNLSNNNHGTTTQNPPGPTCEDFPARGAVYEVPSVPNASLTKIPTTSTESDDTSSGSSLHHTYASEVVMDSLSSTPPQSSSWSSSDVYMGASPPGNKLLQPPDHTTHSFKTHLYINQNIVKMHALK